MGLRARHFLKVRTLFYITLRNLGNNRVVLYAGQHDYNA